MIELESAPYQAQLTISINQTYGFFCGGSIISSTFILTAAHCTYKRTESMMTMRVGTKYKYLGGEVYRVKKINIYPNYDPVRLNNDVALLQLVRSIALVPNVKEAIQLSDQNELIIDDTLAFASGWGLTNNVNESTRFLRGVYLPIVNPQKCQSGYGNSFSLSAQMICAGYDRGDKSACNGKTFKLFRLKVLTN